MFRNLFNAPTRKAILNDMSVLEKAEKAFNKYLEICSIDSTKTPKRSFIDGYLRGASTNNPFMNNVDTYMEDVKSNLSEDLIRDIKRAYTAGFTLAVAEK